MAVGSVSLRLSSIVAAAFMRGAQPIPHIMGMARPRWASAGFDRGGYYDGFLGCGLQGDIPSLKSGSLRLLPTDLVRRDMLRAAVLGRSRRKP